MQKAFEKIVERLKKRKNSIRERIPQSFNSGQKMIYNYMLEECENSIKIVNEVAEEYSHRIEGLDEVINRLQYKADNIKAKLEPSYFTECIEYLKSLNDGWMPCSERLPKVETEVLIYARRKYTDGHFKDIITTAMYEDGTVRENDSCWRWEDIDGEWDEEEECYIIPEGWWENRHYNPDEVYNNVVDDKVIAWRELPPAFQPKETVKDCNTCANYTEPDEVDNGCYMCCKGLENNYQPKGE